MRFLATLGVEDNSNTFNGNRKAQLAASTTIATMQ